MALDLSQLEPSAENAEKHFPPDDIGPIWQKNDDGDWLMPEDLGYYTIGWDAIGWGESELPALKGDGGLRLTPEQMRITLWFYAIDDDGDFVYPQAVYQAFKGAGKDPFGAFLAVNELIGPCRFSHWEHDEDGGKRPVAKDNPDALVQLAGVNKAQTRNTMDMVNKLLAPKALRAKYHLDVQRELVYAYQGQRRLEMLGTNPEGAEGNRASFAVMNEIQHWTPGKSGKKFHDTIADNVHKLAGNHYICITNAYEPGENSVLEDIRLTQERVWAGLEPDAGWLYMSREAHPASPLEPEWVPFIMGMIIGDAWWQKNNMKTLTKKVLDRSRAMSRTRRMYYNQIVDAESKLFTKDGWADAFAEGSLGSTDDLKRGDEVVLGFDGGRSDDATALVAIRIKDKLIVPLMVEHKPEGPLGENWKVQPHVVDEHVRRAFAEYEVRAFFADTHLWESYIAQWSEEFRETLGARASADSAIGWDMSGKGNRKRVADAWDAYLAALADGRLKHNGDPLLTMHALNAYRGHNGLGLVARKEKPDSPRKIDAMVASYVAYAALQAYLEKGKKPARKYRRTMLRA